MKNMIPYSAGALTPHNPFNITTLPQPQGDLLPGQVQGIYISFLEDYQFILNKITGWFSERDEIDLVDHGMSDKMGLGYIILEWYEVEIDTLFLAILRDEEIVSDYTIYTRVI